MRIGRKASSDVHIAGIPCGHTGLVENFFNSTRPFGRVKPTYSECWMLPKPDGFEPITGYTVVGGDVVIGRVRTGETEYNLQPYEYGFGSALNRVMGEIISGVRDDVCNGCRDSVQSLVNRHILNHYDDIRRLTASDDMQETMDLVSGIVHRNTTGAGVFETLLSDPHIEDIYVDAPCERNRIHITMNGIDGVNNHVKCRTNLIVEKGELDALINIIKRESGLRFCHSSPVMETDLSRFDARATVMGYPMSPNGNAVALRKRSRRPWTLSRLVANGTMDAGSAGLLSFLVNSRTSILIAGARGSGKSSIMGAMMMEFGIDTRILTIEDTMELPGDIMRGLGYKVQSILVDERMGGDQLSRSEEALRVSLRMGESAILLGEVRGEEARTLYKSMNTGKSGSSVIGTIHGDSSESVFHRVVEDMGVSPEAFNITDVVMVMKMVRNRSTDHLERRMWELSCTTEKPGVFMDLRDPEVRKVSKVTRRCMDLLQYDTDLLEKDLRIRSGLHRALAEAGAVDETYLGPEWIVKANMSVDVDRDPDKVIRGFRAKIGLGSS